MTASRQDVSAENPWYSQGRTRKVVGSGLMLRSLSSIRTKPSTEEPSKPFPSRKAFSSSALGKEKSIGRPRMSGKMIRMNSIFRAGSRTVLRTSSSLVNPKFLGIGRLCDSTSFPPD